MISCMLTRQSGRANARWTVSTSSESGSCKVLQPDVVVELQECVVLEALGVTEKREPKPAVSSATGSNCSTVTELLVFCTFGPFDLRRLVWLADRRTKLVARGSTNEAKGTFNAITGLF